jgi:hypothetical protein
MTTSYHFPDVIHTRDGGLVAGSRILVLTQRFRYRSSVGTIEVPAGFHTDGASIPRAFWSILGPHGAYFGAAIIHDYLYTQAGEARYLLDRKEADVIFREAMFNAGVGAHRNIMYAAVRMFGWRNYLKR